MRTWRIVIAMLLVAGCATTMPPSLGQQSLQLRVGMAKQDVWKIFGQPQTTSVDGTRETWSYWQTRAGGGWLVKSFVMIPSDPMFASAADRLSVVFVDGKVESWGDQAGVSGIMKATMQATTEAMKNMPPVQIEQTVHQVPATPAAQQPAGSAQ